MAAPTPHPPQPQLQPLRGTLTTDALRQQAGFPSYKSFRAFRHSVQHIAVESAEAAAGTLNYNSSNYYYQQAGQTW